MTNMSWKEFLKMQNQNNQNNQNNQKSRDPEHETANTKNRNPQNGAPQVTIGQLNYNKNLFIDPNDTEEEANSRLQI